MDLTVYVNVCIPCVVCDVSAPAVCLPAVVPAPEVPLWPPTSETEAAPPPSCTHTNTHQVCLVSHITTVWNNYCETCICLFRREWLTCQQGSGVCRPEPAAGWLTAPGPSSDCGTSSDFASSAETLTKTESRERVKDFIKSTVAIHQLVVCKLQVMQS